MVELVQDQGSEYDTHSLDAAAQHAIQLVAVALLQLHAKTSVGPHASSMRKHICHWNCFTKTFSGGHGPSQNSRGGKPTHHQLRSLGQTSRRLDLCCLPRSSNTFKYLATHQMRSRPIPDSSPPPTRPALKSWVSSESLFLPTELRAK